MHIRSKTVSYAILGVYHIWLNSTKVWRVSTYEDGKTEIDFYDFYGNSHLDEIDKKKKVDEYVGFMLIEEIDRFMSFFETDVKVFRYVEKETCYLKQCL
jgi:hypothetical protein